MNFQQKVTQWYTENKRALPWRNTLNPYSIWLSEIIMQQTRVSQGTKYYVHFCKEYPTVEALARAPLNKILKSWEGLGYYSRARNLHAGAQQIVDKFNGQMPSSYKELLTIKGIGPYTAAAISSICFNEKKAVVDGNVYRVLARLHGIKTPINSTEGAKEFNTLANALLANCPSPGDYNQGMMEFGALQCTPQNPDCSNCPFAAECIAFNTNTVHELPVKIKAKKVKNRYFHFLILSKKNKIAVVQRQEKDIWQGLFQFPLIEVTEPKFTVENAEKMGEEITHLLSHQRLHIQFWRAEAVQFSTFENVIWHEISNISSLAFPIVLKRFADSNLLPLPTHKNM